MRLNFIINSKNDYLCLNLPDFGDFYCTMSKPYVQCDYILKKYKYFPVYQESLPKH